MDEKAIICPHCEDAEATEICEWCKGKECKECFKEHMTDCNYCDGEGEIPYSWVSDSGDRWSPPSLDVTDWEMCEYCNEGQVCGDEYIPEFSWDAESLSPEDGIKYVGWQKPAPTHFGYYMSSLHATEPPYETTLCGVKLSGEKEIFYIDNPHPHGSRCSKCQKSVDKRKTDFQSESFSAESDGDKQLDESKKRTKMSAIRTGLAITTFSIVMWNLWTNKKQQKDIADIMALV